MAFTVHYHGDNPPIDEHGDDAHYQFLEGGILKVVPAESHARVSYLAPTVWRNVVADRSHPPRADGTVNPAVYGV